jgi:hypothetical protein
VERINLDSGLWSERQHPLRSLAGRPQPPECLLVFFNYGSKFRPRR